MRVLAFTLILCGCSAAFGQQPMGFYGRPAPLVYPGSALAPPPSAYPGAYSFPKRKAWSQNDHMLNIYEFDAKTRRADSVLRNNPNGLGIYMDLTPQPWMYPWLFQK